MIASSQIPALLADALTLFRLGAAFVILWLGWRYGAAALPAAILIATAGWISDGIDGSLARRTTHPTRLKNWDYPVDTILTWAILLFLGLADFLPWLIVFAYTAVAAIAVLWLRRKAVLVLFMRGIDIIAVAIALRYALPYALPLLAWLLGLGYVTRRNFRQRLERWKRELAALTHRRSSP